MKTWQQSYSDRKVEPLLLTPDMVTLEDIAQALSLKCRFNGHVPALYSVAQHCVIGARLISPAFALPFLLHEVSEVYLPDIPAPVKPSVHVAAPGGAIPWTDLEKIHARVVFEALGLSSLLPLIYSPEVKTMDLAMLAAEKRDLKGPEPEPWGLTVPAVEERIYIWDPRAAKANFLARFYELTGRAPGE